MGETFKEEIKDIGNFSNVKLERKKKNYGWWVDKEDSEEI